MKNYYYIFILTALLALNSCGKTNGDIDSVAYYNVPEIGGSIKEPLISRIEIDSLIIQDDIETSFIGDFSVFNDTLYFSDHLFGYFFRFDKHGNFLDKHIGKGKGPNEVLSFSDAIISNEGYYFVSSSSNNLYFFNKKFQKKIHHRINWQIKRSKQEVSKNPIPSVGDSYEFDYEMPGIFKKWDKGHVALRLTATHPGFNGYFNSSLYYNYSRILAIINVNSGKIVDYVGRRSPVYLSYNNLPNFDQFSYELVDEKVFVNFWIDPTIYVLDKKEKIAKAKFGVKGRDMKTDYQTTSTYEEANELYRQHLEKYGYYRYIKYIPEAGILLRGYSKGEGATTDGLQIYKEESLIGDIDIEKGLEIIGAIDSNLYAVNNYDEEGMTIYKIKLIYD